MKVLTSADFFVGAREVNAGSIAEARRRIGSPIELLALTLHFRVPLWTTDNDFEDCGEWSTTAELLRKSGVTGREGRYWILMYSVESERRDLGTQDFGIVVNSAVAHLH